MLYGRPQCQIIRGAAVARRMASSITTDCSKPWSALHHLCHVLPPALRPRRVASMMPTHRFQLPWLLEPRVEALPRLPREQVPRTLPTRSQEVDVQCWHTSDSALCCSLLILYRWHHDLQSDSYPIRCTCREKQPQDKTPNSSNYPSATPTIVGLAY